MRSEMGLRWIPGPRFHWWDRELVGPRRARRARRHTENCTCGGLAGRPPPSWDVMGGAGDDRGPVFIAGIGKWWDHPSLRSGPAPRHGERRCGVVDRAELRVYLGVAPKMSEGGSDLPANSVRGSSDGDMELRSRDHITCSSPCLSVCSVSSVVPLPVTRPSAPGRARRAWRVPGGGRRCRRRS